MTAAISTNDDDAFNDNEFLPKIRILAIMQKEEQILKMAKIARDFSNIDVNLQPHQDLDMKLVADSDIIIIECRVIEAFEDMQRIRDIRRERPMAPILAISLNDDHHFQQSIFDAGVSDFLAANMHENLIVFKIKSLHSFSQTARILEMKNNEVVSRIKSLREANEKLKQEMSSRIAAESEKAMAEEKVKRTQQIKEIMDALADGFFWVDASLTVSDTLSKNCFTIFGKDLAGQKLGAGALGLVENSEIYLSECMVQVFENIMPLKVTMSLLPKKVRTSSGKIVDLSYTAIQDEKENILKIILVARDVTLEEADREKFEKTRKESQVIINILRNKQAFTTFVTDFRNMVTQLVEEKREGVIKRYLHTLKGNSAAFGLNDVAKKVHDIENLISGMLPEELLANVKKFVDEITACLVGYLEQNHDVLRVSYTDVVEHFTIDSNFLEHMKTIAEASPPQIKEKLLDLVRLLHMKPVSLYTSLFESTVKTLAEKFEKKIDFSIKGLDLKVDMDRFESLFKNLIHTVRNACDHGLEQPFERSEKGKPEIGHLKLSFETVGDDEVRIVIEDDGRGLNRDAILRKVLENKLAQPEMVARFTDDEAYQFIFSDKISTAKEVTDISGRGVGMAALKSQVDELGGNIGIWSQPNIGTRFTISIPHFYKKKKVVDNAEPQTLKIMLCEDEPFLSELYKEVLNREGYNVTVFDNGLDAMLHLHKEEFNLIITDLNMPGMRGESVVEQIRERMDEKEMTPIIIVSGYVSDKVRGTLKKYPYVEILEKPTSIRDLLKAVDAVFENRTKQIA